MLTQGEDVEVHALHQRGWSISAIARHLERDRKTVRAYVRGERQPGLRRRSTPDAIEPFVPYLRARFADDPHLWLTALYDEVIALGYPRSYPTFVRSVRAHGLRPHCEPCHGVRGRLTIEIEHPPGEEIQWDWFERRRAPCGGTARIWRTDRMATVIVPGSADVQPSFAPVAKHYGVTVRPCPPRRGNRKGSVEAAVRYLCGRWWRTMTATTMEGAQAALDAFCATTADDRPRAGSTVRALAEAEPLMALPAMPYPATTEVAAPVAVDATVAYGGNRYSVPHGLAGATLTLRHRLGRDDLAIVAPSGMLVAVHELRPAGAGALVRDEEHRAGLEAAVLAAFSSARPCERKGHHPPGPEARAAAAVLTGVEAREVVVDLARYAELAGTTR